MRLTKALVFVCGLTAFSVSTALASDLPDRRTLRAWVQEMKTAERGPFARIRWFCQDGTIQPPRAFACAERGGGSQHGEWTDRVKLLRANGYYIANFLTDLDIEALLARPDHKDELGQIVIEQFLINADDGWILRRARYYRGALQEEGERAGARELFYKLVENKLWLTRDYLFLRAAAGLVAHGKETASVTEMRQRATALSKKDKGFQTLRNKIHVRPQESDAADVRAYAEQIADPAARQEYLELAEQIELVYSGAAIVDNVKAMGQETRRLDDLGQILTNGGTLLERSDDPTERLAVTANLLAILRDRAARPRTSNTRMGLIDLGLQLGSEHFVIATELAGQVAGATRRQRLVWLEASAEAIYGAGLISARQSEALSKTFARLDGGQVDLATYKQGLDYLGLVPGWASQSLRFHFQGPMHKLAAIEPLAELFIQDQLRGSPLFFYAQVLDSLLRDANRMAGVRNELFGKDVGAGLRSLNPGLARGRLSLAAGDGHAYNSDGIYLLPETIAELPPVAGILTAGEGNPLSHVQLLARNLGIPNVAVNEELIARLKPMEGKTVILAVSAAGSVRLSEDKGEWEQLFGRQQKAEEFLIRPDLEKLDLTVRDFLPLSQLDADDSGRTVGPKAAKLGALRRNFPEAVEDGLAIPFGIFRRLLDQPFGNSGQSAYDWMVAQYRALAKLPADSAQRVAATEAFRARLYDWISNADPGVEFRRGLKAAMARVFGPDGSYGVFVRSDTNVEDLPGFTGAGLNLTVPNVVGFENVLRAIPRVWASPFTERAFAWRQSHMDRPEHVYASILLLRSVPSDKSGVLVTQDIDTGAPGWLSVAVNEGVGGAVDGQAAESLRINTATGEVKLLAQATAPLRRRIDPQGGVAKVPTSGTEAVLEPAEIKRLIALAKVLPERVPSIVDANGTPAPADVEFGFEKGELRLFQIRPFLESAKARGSEYLKSLDAGMRDLASVTVNLDQRPEE